MFPSDNHISSYFKESFRLIFILSRFLGLMPFYYFQDKVKYVYTFKFSPFYAFLSLGMTLALSALLWYSMIQDIIDPSRFVKSIDKYMAVSDAGLVSACLITSTAATIILRRTILQYINHLILVDDMLQLTDATKPKRHTLLMILITTCTMSFMAGYAFYVFSYVTPQVTHYKLQYISFVPYFISYYILLIVSVLYWSVSDGLTRRLRALKNQMTPLLQTQDEYPVMVKRGEHLMDERKWRLEALDVQHMVDLMQLYEHLIEALALFNKLFGPTILVRL